MRKTAEATEAAAEDQSRAASSSVKPEAAASVPLQPCVERFVSVEDSWVLCPTSDDEEGFDSADEGSDPLTSWFSEGMTAVSPEHAGKVKVENCFDLASHDFDTVN